MKFTLKVLLCFFTLSQVKAQSEISHFQRFWVCNPSESQKTEEEGVTDGCLQICQKSASWQVFSNQLYLMFTPRMKGDTLFLVYKENDVGRGFGDFKTWPIVNKPFAKLYRTGSEKLGVIYLNKTFVKAVKQRVSGSLAEKKLIFPAILYLHKLRKPSCEDETTP